MKPTSCSLSIVIPVFNEAGRLPRTFEALNGFFESNPFPSVEVIFVDDGSTDGTAEAIERHRFAAPVTVLRHEKNLGKGASVRDGMLRSTGDYALTLDADMSTPLSEVAKLSPFMERGCPVIIGTRWAAGGMVVEPQPLARRILGRAYVLLANFITGIGVSDVTCGFKCFSRAAIEQIFPLARVDRWSYDAEALFLARRRGLGIVEVPVVWRNDQRSRVRLYRDLAQSFTDLIRIRFSRYQL
jgi:glycosyltransferase involved in cell wall biosynthesis